LWVCVAKYAHKERPALKEQTSKQESKRVKLPCRNRCRECDQAIILLGHLLILGDLLKHF